MVNGTSYKVMSARFSSKCNETKARLNKGDEIFYVPAEKRAYSPTSPTAAFLRENGTLITVQSVAAPVAAIAQTLSQTDAAPALPKKGMTSFSRKTAHGTWVCTWLPNA